MENWPLNVPSSSSDSMVLWMKSQLFPMTSASLSTIEDSRFSLSLSWWPQYVPAALSFLGAHVFLVSLPTEPTTPLYTVVLYFSPCRAIYEVVILALDCVFTFSFLLLPAALEKSWKRYWTRADPIPVCAVIPWECGGHPGCIPYQDVLALSF